MTTAKTALELFATCSAYSLIIALIDFAVILFFNRELYQIAPSLSLMMLAEGGLGLTVGGAVVLYSPIISKIGEVFFRSKPWSAKRQQDAEKQAKAWIVTGTILVLLALFISAL